MAAYISAPRDFSKVKSKVAFNLTARQLVCFGAAAVVGVPLFFVLRDTAGNTGATLGMMAVMLPMFFLAMYQKNGQPAEKILMYYMDTNRVEARFEDGTTLSIDCIAIEDEYGNTPAQRAELDWLLYNKPLEYARLVLGAEIEHYLSLGCNHGRLED